MVAPGSGRRLTTLIPGHVMEAIVPEADPVGCDPGGENAESTCRLPGDRRHRIHAKGDMEDTSGWI